MSKYSRYIDDIIFFYCNNTFDNVKNEIYPSDLVLNKENATNLSASFLDISITVINREFDTKLYDKRNDFNFNIVNFPFLCGNVPQKHSYGVFISQILRYSRVCRTYGNFIDECKTLVNRLIKQGFVKSLLKKSIRKLTITFINSYNKTYHEVAADVFN